jgi:4a-hydroxytetrahydrobiopterin dehydratase
MDAATRKEAAMTEAPRRLTDEEIKLALSRLAGWQVVGGKLHREYKFKDFVTAWGFMSSAALVIQQMDHHPEWSNVYHTVRVDLVTHDAKGITRRDVDLALKLEELALAFPRG